MGGNEVKVTVSAEVNTILSDLYGQIEYELRDDYEDGLEKAMQELERYKNIIDELEKWLKDKSKGRLEYTNYDDVLNKLNKLKELKGE